MKRHHFMTLTAIAIVLAGVFVVLRTMKAPEDDRDTAETLEALRKRQAEHYQRSKQFREHASPAREKGLAGLKEQLLREFPKLRKAPPIPDEENAIHQLNGLIKEVGEDIHRTKNELIAIRSKDEELDVERSLNLLKEHEELIQQLEAISRMGPGSYSFEKSAFNTSPASSLMVMVDLLRLKSEVSLKTEGFQVRPEPWIFLQTIITESKGASMVHHLMTSAESSDPSNMEEVYENSGEISMYAAGTIMMTWHAPYWGRKLNSDALIHELRDYWWTAGPLGHPIQSDPAAIRAYAQYVNDSITHLEEQSLENYLRSAPPAIDSDGLSQEQLEFVKANVNSLEEFLDTVVLIGLHQHQEMVAFRLHSWEESLQRMGNKNPAKATYAQLPLQPISMKPYSFDPETRMLSRTASFRGRKVPPTLIYKPGEGGVWNTKPGFGTSVFEPFEEE